MDRLDRPSRIWVGHAKNQIDVAIYIAWMHDFDDDPAASLPVDKLHTTLTDNPYRTAGVPLEEQWSTGHQIYPLQTITQLDDVPLGQRSHSPRPTHRASQAASCAMSAAGWRSKPRRPNPALAFVGIACDFDMGDVCCAPLYPGSKLGRDRAGANFVTSLTLTPRAV